MRIALLFIVLLGWLGTAKAQAELDSLWRVWQDPDQPDSARARALGKYTWTKHLYAKPDSAEYFSEVMYSFSQDHGLKKWMGWALLGQGVSYKIRGANAKALDYWLRAEALSRVAGDAAGVAGAMNNIGLLYFELGDLAHALDYHRQSLSMRVQCNDSIGVGASLESIGDIHRLQGRLDSALSYQHRALAHNERIRFRMGIGIAHKCLGDIFRDQRKYATALDHYAQCVSIVREEGNVLTLSETLTRMGFVYTEMGEVAKAVAHCRESLAIAVAATNLAEQMHACDCVYGAYKRGGVRDQALHYLERSEGFADSLRVEDVAQQLQRMEFTKQLYGDSLLQAEREQRVAVTAEVAIAREKGRRNLLLVMGGVVLLLAAGLWSRLRYVHRSRAVIKAEMERNEVLLLNILPADVARELKETGTSQARTIHGATILFSDFKDFTQLSQSLSATDLVAEVDACFEAFDHIMEKHGIEKIKTIGDAYMAAGGLPVPTADSTKSTVLAAMEMQEFIKSRKIEHDALGKPAFEMRVGIHTGPVVAGIVGVKKFAYDIWGDTVNTASRMESSGEVGQVNISEATYELVKQEHEFSFIPRGMVEVKGKGAMVMYYAMRSST